MEEDARIFCSYSSKFIDFLVLKIWRRPWWIDPKSIFGVTSSPITSNVSLAV